MKPIKLNGLRGFDAEICLNDGVLPYFGVRVMFDGMDLWFYLQDRDLARLERAIQKTREAIAASKNKGEKEI